eukprot:TRINITY_DN2939_c0_g1_i3.p1 TRINITY_DN2939_c0_g1~~TRINITY_DN2939_c0_g1_i3.p1  ORF type:complete len:739 (+),score=218.36 TRINITY_DN2939_c0_g1_i3:303-2519(+)
MMERPAWLDQDGPANYVAGIGRGATGFTTRSDIGPARAAAVAPDPSQLAMLARKANGEDDQDNQDYSEAQYDQFEGYGGSFMAPNSIYDSEDKEADDIWESIDRKMDEKRKLRREEKMKEEMKKILQERPTISSQFADLKSELSKVDYSEWDSIPEIGDTTQRYKKKAKIEGRLMPAPDSLLDRARQVNQMTTSMETKPEKGMDTPMANDLLGVGQGKKQLLELKMQKVTDNVSGQTNVDPKGYLTSMSSTTKSVTGTAEEASMARLLFASARQTNPQNGPAWIGSVRHEREQGKIGQAKKLILEACEVCPNHQDIWLEAVSLHDAEHGKVILAKGIKHLPKSIPLWLEAVALESDKNAKRKVLRKALEVNPTSEKLWKAAISLEEPEDAKILLSRAVECLPKSVDMWIALQNLETVEQARVVLNKARIAIPTDFSIWIAASELEELRGNNPSRPELLIPKAMKSLVSQGIIIDREQWINEAENCEKKGAKMTCKAIIRQVIDLNIEEEDRKRVWVEDAEACLSRSSVETARTILEHAVTVFPGKKSLWRKLADLEKKHGGSKETIEAVLKKATTYCPKAEILWLMYAKEKWLNNDVKGARDVLENAFNYNPDSEQIWLAAVKLEKENNEPGRARLILSKARENNREKVWRRSVQLERELGNKEEERQLLEECLKKYPQSPKFWMMKGELEERSDQMEAARETYQRGLKNCPQCVPLWICASRLEAEFQPDLRERMQN